MTVEEGAVKFKIGGQGEFSPKPKHDPITNKNAPGSLGNPIEGL